MIKSYFLICFILFFLSSAFPLIINILKSLANFSASLFQFNVNELGATIKEGELLGVVAAPTKYYSEEGTNLYMKMTCDNEPVDPMIFLR